jgi:hypothetical protein
MAYIDTSYIAPQNVNTGGGAGSLGYANVNAAASIGASGSGAAGSGWSVSSWVIMFYVVAFLILISAGLMFNKKGG